MQKKYRAGIIGLGNIGFRYTLDNLRKWTSSHLEAYVSHPDFEPVAGCDIKETRLKDAKDYYPKLRLYNSWEKMLSGEDLDILSVCVSPELNFDVCSSPLSNNLKALILEKPMSRDTQTGMKITEILKAKKTITAVNYFRRWQRTFFIVKNLIDSGKIGKILKINAFYPSGIYIGGSHMIDIIQYMVGDFNKVQSLGKKNIPKKGDSLYTVYGLIGDIEVYMTGFDKNNFNIFDTEIWGEKGKIVITDYCRKIILYRASPSKRFSKQKEMDVEKTITVKEYNSYFSNLLSNISGVLKGKEKNVLCTPEDALKNVRVIEAICHSHASGKAEKPFMKRRESHYEREISASRR